MPKKRLLHKDLLINLRELYQKLENFKQDEENLTNQFITTIGEYEKFANDKLLGKLRVFSQELHHNKREILELQIQLVDLIGTSNTENARLVLTRYELEQEIQRRTEELAEKNFLLKQEVQKYQRSEESLRLVAYVFQASNEGIFITDADANILSVNPSYTNMTGYTLEESLGKDLGMLESGIHNQVFYQNMWEALLVVGYWSGEIWQRRKNGEIFPGWLSMSAVKNDEGETLYYIGIFTDNTHQKLSEKRIYHLSYFDPLTELPNRALFQDRLQQAINRALKEERWVVLLYIDLDHFKAINDAFGHPVGDQLLRTTAQRLVKCLKEEKDAVAKVGGDEFTILLADFFPSQIGLQRASELAEIILTALRQPLMLEGHEVFISASIGISVFPQDGTNVAELLKNADTAMYHAKERGRNCYQFFTDSMNIAVHKRLSLQNNLRRALERDELLLCYQPQLDIANERIIGVEALLRWQHPKLGLVPPAEFIPLAEESGLITPIGEWVLYKACHQNKIWQTQGFTPIRVAVNLSARQFYDEGLLQCVTDVLKHTGLDSHWLELEITESVAMNCADKTVNTLQALKNLGTHLAFDDFGTGYSSLNYLKRFSLDVLKIDGSFISDIFTENGAAIVSAIINIAHSLKMTVIAEGVETGQQLNSLRIRECDAVQGFLFYKPIFPNEVSELLKKQTN